MSQTEFSYGHQVAAEREVHEILQKAAAERRCGTPTTDVRALTEALVEALAKLEVVTEEQEEIDDLKHELNCGLDESERREGATCKKSGEDCAECRVIAAGLKADCGLDEDDRRLDRRCLCPDETCASCKAFRERRILDCGLGETLRGQGDACQLDDGHTCTACQLHRAEARLAEEAAACRHAEAEAKRLREANPDAVDASALRLRIDCGTEEHAVHLCLSTVRDATRPEVKVPCLRCELASAEKERDHHLATVEQERARKREAHEEIGRLRAELDKLRAAPPPAPTPKTPRRRRPPAQEGPDLLERLMASPEEEKSQNVTAAPQKATRKRAARKAAAS